MVNITSSEQQTNNAEPIKQGLNKSLKHWSKKEKIAGLVVVGIFAWVLSFTFSGGGDTSNPNSQPQSPQRLSTGEEGMLNNNNSRQDCEGIVSLGIDKQAFSDLTDASVAKDQIGYARIFAEGRAFTAPNCTKVLAIDSTFTATEVRILEGEYLGASGWVPYEWAISN